MLEFFSLPVQDTYNYSDGLKNDIFFRLSIKIERSYACVFNGNRQRRGLAVDVVDTKTIHIYINNLRQRRTFTPRTRYTCTLTARRVFRGARFEIIFYFLCFPLHTTYVAAVKNKKQKIITDLQ